jgi:hypothetical protein
MMAKALHFLTASRSHSAKHRFSTGSSISCGALSLLSATMSARAQQGLPTALANDAATQARSQQEQQLEDYTYKKGDFRLLVMPAMTLEWNDNVTTTQQGQDDDFIILPTVGLLSSYPLTDRNILQLNVTAGYSEYIKHDSLSSFYLSSGSGLSFDVYIKDILINLHDQFSYMQNSAANPGVANTGTFGTFDNRIGPTVSWNLKKVVLTLGYDHENELSTSGTLSQVDHSTESGYGRVGYQWNSKLTTGVEGTAAYTAYDQTVLNDNTSYSIGVYGDWKPDEFLEIQPRVGYTITEFQQTSSALRTSDIGSWYADLNLSHKITRSLSYSLDVGHQVSGGVQADADENYYANLGLNWDFIKGNRFVPSLFYRHGNQGAGSSLLPGVSNPNLVSETYDWYGGSIGFSHAFTKRLDLSLNYQLTERSSTGAQRGYAQNLVTLQITYHAL